MSTVVTTDRAPLGAVVVGRDRRRGWVLVSGYGLRGGRDWFADAPWTRVLPNYPAATETPR